MIAPDDVFISTYNISSSFVFQFWFLGLYVGATMVMCETRRRVPIVPSQVKTDKVISAAPSDYVVSDGREIFKNNNFLFS